MYGYGGTDPHILNPLTPELNPSAQRCPPRFLLGILIFKGLTARRLYKSFGVGLIWAQLCTPAALFPDNYRSLSIECATQSRHQRIAGKISFPCEELNLGQFFIQPVV
jgi:hypothetical protein